MCWKDSRLLTSVFGKWIVCRGTYSPRPRTNGQCSRLVQSLPRMVIYSINQSTSCRIFFRFGKYQIRAAVSEIIWAFRFIIKWPIIILYISNSFELKRLVTSDAHWRSVRKSTDAWDITGFSHNYSCCTILKFL